MRFRIFPILIVAASLMLTVRIGTLWKDVFAPSSSPLFEESSAFAQATDEEETPSNDDEGKDLNLDSVTDDDKASKGSFMLPGKEEEDDGVPQGMSPADTVDEEDFSAAANLSSAEMILLYDLAKRRKQLESNEKRLQEHEALLKVTEQQLVEKQQSLSIIKSEIEALLVQYDNALDAENQRLINVYSNMKPKSAAAIFNDMEMATLMILVRGMKERKLAPVFAAMNPKKVRLLSKELANDKELPIIPY